MADLDLKPALALSPEQTEQIREAIANSFSPSELQSTLRFKWGMILGNYVDVHQGLYGVVDQLIAWTDRRGKTSELATLVLAERSGNNDVLKMASSLGLALADAQKKYDSTQRAEAPASLEAMIERHSRLISYGVFLSKFRSLGDRICRVCTPNKLGTGFLVGPDLILTNFHVVDEVKTDANIAETTCLFDFRDEAGQAGSASKACGLSSNWLVAKSLFSQSDVTGNGEPQANEFDYALLRLSEKVGHAVGTGGGKRGWFDLVAERPLLAMRDFVVVPQHAEGRPLEVAWGVVMSFNSVGNRVRHNATTNNGSSGAPCLTANLEVFGLHHATDPHPNPAFNQAIPLDLIALDLKNKGAI
jgi:Trypsin-like peptidase domain/Effector-associated domain 1